MSALFLIYGQQNLNFSRMRNRIKNNLRLRDLPNSRLVNKIHDSKEWRAKPYTIGRYALDIDKLKNIRNYFSTPDEQTFNLNLLSYKTNQRRADLMIKTLVNIYSRAVFDMNTHNSHSASLLQFFTPSKHILFLKSKVTHFPNSFHG